MADEKEKKKIDEKSDDPFLKLKNIAYRVANHPAKFDDPDLADYIQYAKFQICFDRKIGLYDPMWDNYSDEQVLVEYYALLFEKDKAFKDDFEAKIGVPIEDDIDWMEQEIEKNRKEVGELKTTSEKKSDEFEDTPDSLVKEDPDGILD